jgi:hypothetical protein
VFQNITEAIGHIKQHQYTLVFQNISETIGHINNINIYPGVPKHQRVYRTHKQHQYTLVFQNITEAIGHIKQHQYTLVEETGVRRQNQTCRKSLANFITKCCIDYTSQ